MNTYDFKFNGKWLSEFGGLTIHRPPIETAERDIKIVELAGKDEADVIDLGRYKTVEMTREVNYKYISPDMFTSLPYRLRELYSGAAGYQDFEDTDHPNMVTQAVLTGFKEIDVKLRRVYSATLNFKRKPFWYLKDGLVMQESTSGNLKEQVVTNPFSYKAMPYIKITLTNSALSDDGKLTYTHLIYGESGDVYKNMFMTGLVGPETPGTEYPYVIIDIANGSVTEHHADGSLIQFVKWSSTSNDLMDFCIPGKTKVSSRIGGYFSNCAAKSFIPRWRTL